MSWFCLCGHMLITISNDAEKYANIRKISDYLGKDVCESILAFYAITGSDTTSYSFCAGKVKTFKEILSNQTKLQLIKELGKKTNYPIIIRSQQKSLSVQFFMLVNLQKLMWIQG